jgi:hypothetical protein
MVSESAPHPMGEPVRAQSTYFYEEAEKITGG